MRFDLRATKQLVKEGVSTKRTIVRFLWFPVKIGQEMRWLEIAMIHQEADIHYDGWTWKNISWGN